MRVALYTRFPDEMRAARGADFDALEKLAYDIGASRILAYRDVEAVEVDASGLPRFDCLRSDLKAGLIDGIVFQSLNRLAGEEGCDDLEKLAQAIENWSIPIHTLAEGGVSAQLSQSKEGGEGRCCYVWYVIKDAFGPTGSLGVWSQGLMVRSFRWSGRRQYGTGTSRERHYHARRPSSNTAIASFALDAEPGARDQPEDGCKVAQAGDVRASEDRDEALAPPL